MEVDQEQQHLVNGALMKKYTGQMCRVYLNVMNTSTGGRQVSEITRIVKFFYNDFHLQVQGTTTDKKTVTVALDSPLNQPLSGWIEVIGTPAGNGSTINCSEVNLQRYLIPLTPCLFLLRSRS
jgi:hypothetical protein